jgi:O-antigen ligase
VLAVTAVLVVVAFVIATASVEHTGASDNPATGAKAARLTSLHSHRYAYWKVALGAFRDHPLVGLGSGGFHVRWLERRKIPESVSDAHSLYVETAGELGLIGLLALGAFFAGIVICARRCMRTDVALAAGPLAAFVTWTIHAGVDWLWEMPAVSLVALALGALLVSQSEAEP